MECLIIFSLVLLNGIFAMSEIALVSVRKARLAADIERGSGAAKIALRLAEDPERFLSTVQIGITLIGILTGLYSGEVLSAGLADFLKRFGVPKSYLVAQGTIVAGVTYLSLVFGELVPKRLAIAYALPISKFVAPPMYALSFIASPFVWLLSKSMAVVLKAANMKLGKDNVTEEEIKSMIQAGTESGEVQEVEQGIMERVFSLGDRSVDSIMTHRSDIVWFEASMGADEVRKTVRRTPYKNYIVARESLEHPVGIAQLKALLNTLDSPSFSLSEIIEPIDYFHEDTKVYKVLEDMRERRLQFGVIYDEFGTVQGIVTMKDVLTALLGYEAGHVAEPQIVARKAGGWLVDGQCSFYDFLTHFDMEKLYQENDYNTLSGLILAELQHVPETGEKFDWQGFTFEIADMDGARIDKVIVSFDASKKRL